MEEFEYNNDEPNLNGLIRCRNCQRNFNQLAIAKHEKVCKKVFFTERKKFDMKKKRIVDADQINFMKEMDSKKNQNQIQQKPNKGKVAKWKKMSEELRAVIRLGKNGGAGGNILFNYYLKNYLINF